MYKLVLAFSIVMLVSCKSKQEKIKPTISDISESIYASGIIKSKNQYQAYATVNGIIQNVFLSEGDSVKVGTPILSISNEAQKLIKENALLAEQFSDINANQGKINEAKLLVELSKNKLKNDSALYFRQKNLWEQQIGSKVELEQKELAYQNSKTSYFSSVVRFEDIKRQLNFTSEQSKKNLQISSKQENDFTLKSEIIGVVYNLFKSKGEIVGLQTPLAVIGDTKHFILEMQVDEYDIFKIKDGLSVLVTMDSYKGKVFEAKVTKIYPIMNERSKTFLVEAEFIQQPATLYPNITFEANIVLQSKQQVMLLPRNYLINDSMVVKPNGEKVVVKTGLKNYQNIEILSGITANDELIKPVQ
ncbi:MAG: efflux RND transporter periplasmic adaptor subunit [Bacteroidota bacterium]|nr:efflux RND transporter periplasmic adaptor subunit [Bacteroidota bacterium]